MKLTPRGRAAVGLVVVSMVLGWQFGSRSLNAVAAPIAIALLVGAAIVYRAEPPTVELSPVDPGFPGERRRLSITLSGAGLTTVELPLPEGVVSDDVERTVTLPDTIECDLELADRGFYYLGPVQVRQRDPLGLLERRVETRGTSELAVYPELYSLSGDVVLSRFFQDELEAERQEFERLREYTRGDPLRHVHWKSSAKHDEFLVMEFAPSERSRTVTIAGSASGQGVDGMARVAATIADVALEGGFNVELAVPEGHVPPGQGSAHRENILWLLARTGDGSPRIATGEADVEIRAGREETTVRIRDAEYSVEELVAASTDESTEQAGPTDAERTEVTA